MQNSRTRYPSVVEMSANASIKVCHFFTMEHNLSLKDEDIEKKKNSNTKLREA